MLANECANEILDVLFEGLDIEMMLYTLKIKNLWRFCLI